MSENIIVDREKEHHKEFFDMMEFLGVSMGCEPIDKTLILDFSDMYKSFDKINFPKDKKESIFPENLTLWTLSMSKRSTLLDYITNFGFLHEDLHIVVYHLLKDDITPEQMDYVQNCFVDSVESYVFLLSLIGKLDTTEEMWEKTSQMYSEIERINHSDIPYVWIPPDMKGQL